MSFRSIGVSFSGCTGFSPPQKQICLEIISFNLKAQYIIKAKGFAIQLHILVQSCRLIIKQNHVKYNYGVKNTG